MTLSQPQKKYTVQEYYALEDKAQYKSDYYNGEIFDMSGGTLTHSLICCNVTAELRNRLASSPCVVLEWNMRVKIKFTGLRCYPDASVYCQPIELDEQDPRRTTATNPTLVVEVLSPSTEAYDRGFKSENYRMIASLKAYVLVSKDKAHVEIYLRQANSSWLLCEASGLDSTLAIPFLGIDLPLAGIYARVDFNAEAPPPTAMS